MLAQEVLLKLLDKWIGVYGPGTDPEDLRDILIGCVNEAIDRAYELGEYENYGE